MPSQGPLTNRLSLAVVAAALLVALTGCTATGLFSNTRQERFPDRASLSKGAPTALREADWIPADAFSITSKRRLDRTGDIITFASASGVTDPSCVAGPLRGAVPVTAGWWPDRIPADGLLCGRWRVFSLQGQWYGWLR